MIYSTRWFNKKVTIKRSKIHGYGVFAKQDILKGDIVLISGGVIVPKKDLFNYQKNNGDLGLQIDDNFYIAPISRDEIHNGGVNHSCNPNIGFNGDIILKAIRNISKGEECTVDYSMCYSDLKNFTCKCGSNMCRKKITGNDWNKKFIQKKYINFFTNYIKSKLKKNYENLL